VNRSGLGRGRLLRGRACWRGRAGCGQNCPPAPGADGQSDV